MCELVAQFPKSGYRITKAGIRQLAEVAVDSAESNPDAWGVMGEGICMRSGQTMSEKDIEPLSRNLENVPYAIFHTRLGTGGGDDITAAHPFTYKGHKLVHNGVSYDHPKEEEGEMVDSESILRDIVNSNGDTTVEKFKSVMSGLTGRASIFLEDPDGRLFYYRDRSNLYYVEDENSVFAATKKVRLKSLGFSKSEIKPVESYKIFEISGMKWDIVDEVERSYASYSSRSLAFGRRGSTGWSKGSKSNPSRKGYKNANEDEDKDEDELNKKLQTPEHVCSECLQEIVGFGGFYTNTNWEKGGELNCNDPGVKECEECGDLFRVSYH